MWGYHGGVWYLLLVFLVLLIMTAFALMYALFAVVVGGAVFLVWGGWSLFVILTSSKEERDRVRRL